MYVGTFAGLVMEYILRLSVWVLGYFERSVWRYVTRLIVKRNERSG